MSFREGILAVELFQVAVQVLELIVEESDVERFELLQDLVGEDEVKAIDFASAAADIDRDEGLKLLQDTVTEGQLEVS